MNREHPTRPRRRRVATSLVTGLVAATVILPSAADAQEDFDFRLLDTDGNVLDVDGSPNDRAETPIEVPPPSLPSLASTIDSGVDRYVLVIDDADPDHFALTLAAIVNAGGLVGARHDSIGSALVTLSGDQATDLGAHPWVAAIDVNRGVGLLDRPTDRSMPSVAG
ncbi:MAG: hypothetical protein ACPHJ1_07525, partial [Ilumatobacteraceae bacterium]